MRRTYRSLLRVPGWRESTSTLDMRTREKREEDRKRRQLEKLPKPELLWTPQNVINKTTLCDAWYQPVVYENELDTPRLFNQQETTPSDFFLFVDAAAFSRTAYPELPVADIRGLDAAAWAASPERQAGREYMTKHGIVPTMFRGVADDVNINLSFAGSVDAARELRSFWLSPHFGNFIELKELQKAPTIAALHEQTNNNNNNNNKLYSLFVVCPDYPYRVKPEPGFFLHYVVANISATSPGDVVVPYVPPLPTEDAGAFRVMYVLMEQTEAVETSTPSSSSSLATFDFESRRRFRLHDDVMSRRQNVKDQGAAAALAAVEGALADRDPCAVRFLHTIWDIQVQEWYLANNLEEPTYVPDDAAAEVLMGDLPMMPEQANLSRFTPRGAINEAIPKHQRSRAKFGHFTVPNLSRRVRRPEQGLPLPSPTSGAY
eukprot:PhM_4_TR4148/c1_g1_i1/m.22015